MNIEIEKYEAFFHDGCVLRIEHHSNNVILDLESAEMLPEWNYDMVPLSKRNRLSGKLHINTIKRFSINDEAFKGRWKLEYDNGSIFDLELGPHKMLLLVIWNNYPPKERFETDMFSIAIEADKIYWENLPSLCDQYWKD